MARPPDPSRREFLQVVGTAGVGLVLGVDLRSWRVPNLASPDRAFSPNAFLQVDPDGQITIRVIRSEMGQGVLTAMTMLVAEELEADWSAVRVEQALADSVYGDQQFTNSSRSAIDSWIPLRQAGAAARTMLISAAAQTWKVSAEQCMARNGQVLHERTGRRLSYGELAVPAANLPIPAKVSLKNPRDFRLIGQRIPRLDTPAKVDGSAVFGLDVSVPGMLYGSVARCPVFGGRVARFDDARARTAPGVRAVVQIDGGVGVVADSTWAALEGRRALEITWDEGPHATLDSDGIARAFREAAKGSATIGLTDGDAVAALAAAGRRIDAVYEAPFQAHACMEPMTCTAQVSSDHCELWLPTQTPQSDRKTAAGLLGLKLEAVAVHTTLLGGGFGRKQMDDYVIDALQLSRSVQAPVKVTWTREDDLQHDFYRTASYHELSGMLGADGRPTAWRHRVVATSPLGYNWRASVAAGTPWPGVTSEQAREWGPVEVMEGADQLPYRIPHLLVDAVEVELPVPVGWWRSISYSQNVFANESFIDELAHAAGADPYRFRRELLSGPLPGSRRRLPPADPPESGFPSPLRLRAVLDAAADRAGWGSSLAAGHFQGIACSPFHGSETYVAAVAEISLSDGNEIRVHRVACAIDCGQVINPDLVESQVQGSVVYGLTAALKGAITIERGRVVQSNFHDYPMLSIAEMPSVEVHIIPSTRPPAGAGEAAVPLIAPAVANAVFQASGRRLRTLPLRL